MGALNSYHVVYMYFLQECAQCGALNQINTESWSDAKKKLSCHQCGQSNVFGNVMEEITLSNIEMVADELGRPVPAPKPSENNIQIYWECGTCHKASQFSSRRITEKGAKVTCNKCFNFILLRPMAATPDVPMIQVEHVAPEVVKQASSSPPSSGHPPAQATPFDNSPTTRIQKQDIVEVYQRARDESSKETMIKTGYVDPRTPKQKPEITNEREITRISVPDIDEIVSDPVQYQPSSVSDQKIDELFSNHSPVKQSSPQADASKPLVQSNAANPEISQAYMNENSFVAYKEFKEDASFVSYNILEENIKDIDPDEKIPQAIKNFENNMIRYSLIASVVLAVMIVVFFFVQEWRKEQVRKKAEEQRQELLQKQEEESKNKPKYGFPSANQ
ncbi:MAG: hypothetical protein R3A45_10380 [Bdellovibrionota bacterium]